MLGQGVAPPQGIEVVAGSKTPSSLELPPHVDRSHAAMAENPRSPLLTAEQRRALQKIPGHVFLLPGGKGHPPLWIRRCFNGAECWISTAELLGLQRQSVSVSMFGC